MWFRNRNHPLATWHWKESQSQPDNPDGTPDRDQPLSACGEVSWNGDRHSERWQLPELPHDVCRKCHTAFTAVPS